MHKCHFTLLISCAPTAHTHTLTLWQHRWDPRWLPVWTSCRPGIGVSSGRGWVGCVPEAGHWLRPPWLLEKKSSRIKNHHKTNHFVFTQKAKVCLKFVPASVQYLDSSDVVAEAALPCLHYQCGEMKSCSAAQASAQLCVWRSFQKVTAGWPRKRDFFGEEKKLFWSISSACVCLGLEVIYII